MVTTLDLVLKPDQRAVVKYLLATVASRHKKKNSPEYRKAHLHDVQEACVFIDESTFKKTLSMRLAGNLLFGNTIAFYYQVDILEDVATEALRKVNPVQYLALMREENIEEWQEEERKKRTREQMEIGLEDDKTTPKKKKKQNDDYLIASPATKFTARQQDITMQEAPVLWKNDNTMMVDDDLEQLTEEEFELMMNMDNLTFVDRMEAAAPENVRNMTPDLELERPPSRNNHLMAQDDEIFEPRHEEQRINMEQEMDDARLRLAAEPEIVRNMTPDLELERPPSRNRYPMAQDDEIFEPRQNEQRINMEQEMDDARIRLAAEPENVRNMTPDLELERPPSRNNYPMAQDDELFEPRHEEQRINMEQEMDDARLRLAAEPEIVRNMTPDLELERPPSRNNYPMPQDDEIFGPRHDEQRINMEEEMDDARLRLAAEPENVRNMTPDLELERPPSRNNYPMAQDDELFEPRHEEQRINMEQEMDDARLRLAAEPENVRNMTADLELERPPMRNNYPMAQDDEIFEPRHEEQRINMEQEIDDARLRGHRGLLELNENILIPPPKPRAPRVRRRFRDMGFDDGNARLRLPQREMRKMKRDYSSLHHKDSEEPRKKMVNMTLDELLSTVPYSMRKPGHKELAAQFPTKWIKYDPDIKPNVEEEEDAHQIFDNNLPPIDLDDLGARDVAREGLGPDVKDQEEKDDDEEEEAHQIFDNNLPPIDLDDLGAMDVENPMNYRHSRPQSPENVDFGDFVLDQEPADDPPEARLCHKVQESNKICKNLLIECKKMNPSSFRLDSKMEVGKTTCREAAETFYAALVLLKNQAITAEQVTPFGPIDLTFVGNNSDDLDELANDVEDLEIENGLDVAEDVEEMEAENV